MRPTFDLDWDLAVKAHGLTIYIEKAQQKAREDLERVQATLRGFGGGRLSTVEIDEDAEKEVAEAREAIWKFQAIIYGAFDYCAPLPRT
eukprot:1195516-Prymnesium_polylepis.1